MKIETDKKSTPSRRPSMSSPISVQRTRIKKTGVNAIKDRVQDLELRSKNHVQVNTSEKRSSNMSLIIRDEESCKVDSKVSNTCVNQLEECLLNGDSNVGSCDMEVNSVDLDKTQDQVVDESLSSFEDVSKESEIKFVKENEEQKAGCLSVEVNVCEAKKKDNQESKEEENVVVDTNSDGINNGGSDENDEEREKNMVNDKNDKELIGKSDRNEGGNEIIEVKGKQIKSKRIIVSSSVKKLNSKPSSSTFPLTSTSNATPCKGGKYIGKPPSSSSLPSTSKGQYAHDHSSRSPETHGKLQFIVDIVMWRDVSRSAFIFGIGTFSIISSSFTKDLNFSLISVASYLTLVYLAVVFLCKSFLNRGIVDDEVVPESEGYIWGEDEAIWVAKMVLPYLNESFLKLRVLFSGDPAITLKVALVLFILARCGSSITVWTMVKLGFFGVFILPKFCSSYSSHILAYANFWMKRFQDAWTSCSHKKALAFIVFILVWKFSSVIARAWAAFMLFVAFRCYHQYSIPQDNFNDEQIDEHNVRLRRQSTRHRGKVSTSTPLNQLKEKKSF